MPAGRIGAPEDIWRGVKFVLDGSIQGWTAAMNWPGYYTGTDHGQLLTIPEQLVDWLRPFHDAGINVHMHCNGEATIDVAIDAVEAVLKDVAWLDHRHTVQHSQLTNQAHFRRMKALGMCANIFANHIWYWGDQHHDITVGTERARRMEAAATAEHDAIRTLGAGRHSFWRGTLYFSAASAMARSSPGVVSPPHMRGTTE